MIGRLLQTAATSLAGPRDTATRGNSQRNLSTRQFESNIEEAHTRDLIYPDIEALKTSQHSALSSINGRVPATPAEANSFDDRGGLDVIFPHDVRVIIAQDANARLSSQVLFDSKYRRTSTPQQEHGPASSQRLHNRGKSLTSPQLGRSGYRLQTTGLASPDVTTPTSPLSPSRPRSFFGDGHTAFDTSTGSAETTQSRHSRENKEETDGLLTCIFGAPGHRMEPGTKLHVLPKHLSEAERPQTRLGPGGMSVRRSNLTRPTSGFDGPKERGQSAPPTTTPGRTSIMITRLFNVQLPETTVTDADADEETPTTPTGEIPSTIKGQESSPGKSRAQTQRVKQKKTPAYAIAIIIQLPTEPLARTRSNPSAGVVSLPSSYQSSAPVSPRLPLHSPVLNWMDVRVQGSMAADSILSSQIAYVLGNWALLSRNMRLLEITAKLRLKQLLESIIPVMPTPVQSQGKAGNLKIRRPKLPSQQAVFVNGDCLQDDLQVRKQARSCLQNIADGLRTRRVTPGQSRWGAWREEARSISRWAGTKDQNFFFFVFMTAFLGQHTRWLEQLAPSWWRKHAAHQKRFGDDSREALPRRTVLVCSNKMDARRLIFLAASFLPTNFKNSFPSLTPPLAGHVEHSSSLPTPRDTFVQSGLRKSHSAKADAGHSGHGRSVSFSIALQNDEPTEEERSAFGEDLGRRVSEAGSVRSNFTPLNNNRESRKTSTSTVLADSQLSAQPVPHFANVSVDARRESHSSDRPSSSASMASAALNQALRRSESAGAASVGSRLGHMVSGFWGTAFEPESMGSESAITPTETTPLNRRLQLSRGQSTNGIKAALRSPNKLDRMVEEANQLSRGSPPERNAATPTSLGRSPGGRGPLDLESCLKKTPTGTTADSKPTARNIPKRADAERIPLHLAMNETDGFVDVSMPAGHSLATSLASSFTSLRMSSAGYPSAYSSMTGLWAGSGAGALITSPPDRGEHHSPYGSPSFSGGHSPRPEKTPEVAGWLRTFHPDFLLQAVQPYEHFDADIRAALEAEARLSHPVDHESTVEESGEWRELASILVASTSRFSVERVILQRRKRRARASAEQPSKAGRQLAATDAKYASTDPADDHGVPFFGSPASSAASLTEMQTEERIITEPIMDVDPLLIDAFERVLAQVPSAELRAQSRVHSRTPSRAESPTRSRPVSVRGSHPGQHPQSSSGTKNKQAREAAKNQGTGIEQKVDSGSFSVSQSAGKDIPYQQVPFAECRNIILGALEEIARHVTEDRDTNDFTGNTPKVKTATAGGAVLSGHGVDGTLREGVHRWLSHVEEASKHLR